MIDWNDLIARTDIRVGTNDSAPKVSSMQH